MSASLLRVTLTGATLAAFAVGSAAPASAAEPDLSDQFRQVATHPLASKSGLVASDDAAARCVARGVEPRDPIHQLQDFDGDGVCLTGDKLRDLEFTRDGALIASYGDWYYNTDTSGHPDGRTAIVPLDVSTMTWGQAFFTGSESNDVIRKGPDGSLYLPATDPSGKAATGTTRTSRSGYVTDQGGSWRFVDDGTGQTHTFDVAVNGSDILTFNSRRVLRSTDGGKSFVESLTTRPENTTDLTRFYWGATAGGKVYTSAHHTAGLYQQTEVLSGGSWSSIAEHRIGTPFPNRLVVFKGNIVSGSTTISSFNGSKLATYVDGYSRKDPATGYTVNILDFYVDDQSGHLYVLYSDGLIKRTSDAKSFEVIGDAGTGFHSIAVRDSVIYLGGERGGVWRSDVTVSELKPETVTDAAPTKGNGKGSDNGKGNGKVNATGKDKVTGKKSR